MGIGWATGMVAQRATRRQQHDAAESAMNPVPGIDLPMAPSRGNRRTLEAMWLERLEQSGFQGSDLEVPAKPPVPLVSAVRQFNEGRYWDCHETLEDLWRETPYPLRFCLSRGDKGSGRLPSPVAPQPERGETKAVGRRPAAVAVSARDSGNQDQRAEGRGRQATRPAGMCGPRRLGSARCPAKSGDPHGLGQRRACLVSPLSPS